MVRSLFCLIINHLFTDTIEEYVTKWGKQILYIKCKLCGFEGWIDKFNESGT